LKFNVILFNKMENKQISKNDEKKISNKNDLISRISVINKMEEDANEDFDNDKIKKVFEKVSLNSYYFKILVKLFN